MEAKTTVEGVELTEAESMAVRVALNSFIADLRANGLAEDEAGKRLAAGYIKNGEAVLSLIHKKTQRPGRSRLDWLFMVAMPAFVLGGALTFATLWLGPMAVRDKVIAEYESDVMRLARELEAERVGLNQ